MTATASPRAESTEGVSREELASLLRRRLWLVLVCVVLAPAAALVGTLTDGDRDWEATASLVYRPLPFDSTLFPSLTPENPLTFRETRAITEAVVAADAARGLSAPLDADAVAERVRTRTRDGEDVRAVTITARDRDGRIAIRIANAYAEAYARVRADIDTRRLRNALLSLRAALREEPAGDGRRALRDQLAELRELHDLRRSQTRFVERATAATRADRQIGRRLAIGLALGLLLALGSVLLLEQLDRRIRSREEAERLLGLPVLDIPVALERARAAAEGRHVLVSPAAAPEASARVAARLRAAAEAAGYDLEVTDGALGDAPGAGAGLLALELGRTARDEAASVRARLAAAEVPVIGLVIDP